MATESLRTAVQLSDGHIQVSDQVSGKIADLERYEKFSQGMEISQIAKEEGRDPEFIAKSIKQGQLIFEQGQEIRLRDLRYRAELINEQAKSEIRMESIPEGKKAVKSLLEGKRTVVECNKITGEVVLHEIRDPDVQVQGLEQLRKMIDFDKKPTPQTVVNIQQNNQNNSDSGPRNSSGDRSYEDSIARIRRQQLQIESRSDGSIEVQPNAEEPADAPIEAELVEPEEERSELEDF